MVRKLLIVVLLVLALGLASMFLPARQMNIEGIGRLSFETKITLSVGSEVAYASPDIEILRPNGAGYWTQLNRKGASYNWDCVDDVTPDDDATYVWNPQPKNIDTYATQDSSVGGGTINRVTVYIRANATKGAASIAQTMIRTYGVDYEGSVISLTTSWTNYSTPYITNPSTASSWTWSEVNALECGVILGSTGGDKGQCTQVYVEVDYSPSISNVPSTKDFGFVSTNRSYWSNGSAPTFPLDDGECYFTLTNNSSAPVNISIKATNFSGGVGWTLAGTPGVNIVTLKAGRSGDAAEGNMVTLTTGDQGFITSLPASQSRKWEIKLETGTFTDSVPKSSTITLTATFS